MKTRTIITSLFALVLIALVMGVAAVYTFSGGVGTQKFSTSQVWEQAYANSQSMKIIDLNADGQDDLFVQNLSNVSVFAGSGAPLFGFDFAPPLATSMGDANGDGAEDIVVFSSDSGNLLTVIVKGEPSVRLEIDDLYDPARIAVLRFSSGPQIIIGDDRGQLVALTADGRELWRADLPGVDETRGLDDALVNGQIMVASASRGGAVMLFNDQGVFLWQYNLSGGLRRLRAYDLNGDGTSEILLGGESGQFVMLNAATGEVINTISLGQTLTEIREAEIDGLPESREFVIGGKNGGVWAYDFNGSRLWSASLSDKVTEIAGIDIDSDGVEEVIIGDESGQVALFAGASGERHNLLNRASGIARIDSGKLNGLRGLAIADASGVQFISVETSALPALKFTPLLAGLIASVVIAAAAWFIATNPPKPATRLAVEDQSAESLMSQRRMLKENIADVERLKQAGEMTPDAYLKRLKELRSQMADNEAAMKKAGLRFIPETFQCPNCGGTLPLGLDRCEYCGQVVIS